MKKAICIVIVFTLGYIFGEIEMESILKELEREFIALDTVELIGLFSSITTLLVFLMYIVGKIYSIKSTEMFLKESFFVKHDNDTSDINITKEIELEEDLTAYETIYLVPSDPIRYIRFYNYDWENDCEGELIEDVGKLKVGEALCIKTHLPCGIPKYIIKYERFDYVIGTLVLQEDGRGLTNIRTPEIKHTLKSYFYHLVRA